MLAGVLDVLTCSNVTCPDAPVWYEIVENWAAHGFLGVLLGACLRPRLAAVVIAGLAVKELAGDVARNPSLTVVTDSTLDLTAVALGVLSRSAK